MITHIERPILAMELSKIFAQSGMNKSDKDIIDSIMNEISNNKSVIDLDHDDKNALINILNKHMCVETWN
jgi:hypothetical protein